MSELQDLSREQRQRIWAKSLVAEHKRRKQGIDKVSPYVKYKTAPALFIQEVLKDYLWSKQLEICEAIMKYDRVAVKSCHESGKSWTAARIVCWFATVNPPDDTMVVTSATTHVQVRDILWKEINRAHTRAALPGRTNQTEWWMGREIVALGRKPEDASPTAFQGMHAGNMLVVFDEAGGMPSALWVAAETLVANEGAKILAIGNPDDPQTEFGEVCKPGSGWHVITISAFSTPNLTGEEVPLDVSRRLCSSTYVERWKKKYGEDHPLYQSKVLGEFPESSSDSLIPMRWVTAAVSRVLDPIGDNELGVDVARFGRNETVIIHRRGPVARIHKAFYGRDLMEVCGHIMQAIRDTGARRVKIDDAGMGGGVTDRLMEIKRERNSPIGYTEITPINVGASPTETEYETLTGSKVTARERFANLKAELSWNLRDRFESGDIDLDDDLDLQAQTCTIQYKVDSRGKMYIESKGDVEKRLAKIDLENSESTSPDRFDALVLAFADVYNDHVARWIKAYS